MTIPPFDPGDLGPISDWLEEQGQDEMAELVREAFRWIAAATGGRPEPDTDRILREALARPWGGVEISPGVPVMRASYPASWHYDDIALQCDECVRQLLSGDGPNGSVRVPVPITLILTSRTWTDLHGYRYRVHLGQCRQCRTVYWLISPMNATGRPVGWDPAAR